MPVCEAFSSVDCSRLFSAARAKHSLAEGATHSFGHIDQTSHAPLRMRTQIEQPLARTSLGHGDALLHSFQLLHGFRYIQPQLALALLVLCTFACTKYIHSLSVCACPDSPVETLIGPMKRWRGPCYALRLHSARPAIIERALRHSALPSPCSISPDRVHESTPQSP